jgi:hypothetical protein
MSGNVREWTSTTRIKKNATTGGAWHDDSRRYLKAANAYWTLVEQLSFSGDSLVRSAGTGFRCAR